MEHILSLSYGKDSLACLGAIEQLGWPLDRIIHAEVWATDTIPADLPPMVEFKEKADRIIKERWGIEVERVSAVETYDSLFHKIPEKRKRPNTDFEGKCRGFPFQKGAWCQRDLKVNPIEQRKTAESMFYSVRRRGNRVGEINGFPMAGPGMCLYQKPLKVAPISKSQKDCITYLGIAADEPNRFGQLSAIKKSPLVEADWTEADCWKWCEKNDLLSPTYTTSTRGGCWFCHNQLRQLRHNYPELWKILMQWDLDSPVPFKPDGHTVHDFDERFLMEDQGFIRPDEPFRWSMLEDGGVNYRLF